MIRRLLILATWSTLGFLVAEPWLAPAASPNSVPATSGGPAASDSAVPTSETSPLGLVEAEQPPLDSLAETRERPVFAATRRPPAPPAAPAAALPPPPRFDGYRLTGVVRSSAKVMILLQETATGRMVELQVGERIDGWTVTRIDDTSARLAAGGREIVLSQDREATGGAAPTAGGRATRWLPSRR